MKISLAEGPFEDVFSLCDMNILKTVENVQLNLQNPSQFLPESIFPT